MNENITLRQLRGFLAVARERSFTRAADRLNVTQSALTASVRALEGELGLRLFDRTTRIVEPTAHGLQFAAVAERILDDLGEAIEDLRAYAERRRGRVAIAATATMINQLLIPALGELSLHHPGIQVQLVEDLTAGAVTRLTSGEIDLALTTLEQPTADVDVEPILKDRFELVCAPGHPLAAGRVGLKWSVFAQHESVGLSRQSGIRALLDGHATGQHATRTMRYEVSSVSGLTAMVADNLGIAAVPGLIASEMAGRGLIRRTLTPALWRTVSLATRPGRSPTPAASAVMGCVLDRLTVLRDSTIETVIDVKRLGTLGFELR